MQKLMHRVRHGAKICRVYDKDKTPYQRVLASDQVSAEAKPRLAKLFMTLNPARLQREICRWRSWTLHPTARRGRRRNRLTPATDGRGPRDGGYLHPPFPPSCRCKVPFRI